MLKRSQTIEQRLKRAFLLIGMVVAVSGAVGIALIFRISHETELILSQHYPRSMAAYRLETDIHAELLAVDDYINGVPDAEQRMNYWHDEALKHLEMLRKAVVASEDQRNLAQIIATHLDLERLTAELVNLSVGEDNRDKMLLLLGRMRKDVDIMMSKMEQIVLSTERDMALALEDAQRSHVEGIFILSSLTLIAFGLAYWLGRRIALRICAPMKWLMEASQQIAAGNLAFELRGIEGEDELADLARAYDRMAESLRRQIGEIVDGTAIIASSVAELSASTRELAASAEENAASINETTSTTEQIKQTAQMANSKAEQMARQAQQVLEMSDTGRKAARHTLDGMQKIDDQMGSIAETIVRLSEHSQSIGQIITTVDGLAEQSNVLAVNASIEAAKVGEQGKGFAVVAQEVRSLAEQSKQATMQVRNILNEIQKATSTAVMVTEQGSKVVEDGTSTASEAGDVIDRLSRNMEETSSSAIQIAATSQQQLIGIDQITTAMESVLSASQQNACSAKELQDATHSLQALGERLRGISATYTI